MIIPLKFSTGKNTEVAIYPPEGKPWGNALWKSKDCLHFNNWFEISMPRPCPEAKFTLVARIGDEKITSNSVRIKGDDEHNSITDPESVPKIHDVHVAECMLKQGNLNNQRSHNQQGGIHGSFIY